MQLRDQGFADRIADDLFERNEALEAAHEAFGWPSMTRQEYRELARTLFQTAARVIENSAAYNYVMLNAAACEDAAGKDEDVYP